MAREYNGPAALSSGLGRLHVALVARGSQPFAPGDEEAGAMKGTQIQCSS